MKKLKLNDYGNNLVRQFEEKSGIRKDIESQTFNGTLDYDIFIHTMSDLIGWLLISYSDNVFDVIDEWEEMKLEYNVYGFSYENIREELNKCFDVIREDVERKRLV